MVRLTTTLQRLTTTLDALPFNSWLDGGRGFLQRNGLWNSRNAYLQLPYFCVKPKSSCDNIFTADMFSYDGWLRMKNHLFFRFYEEGASSKYCKRKKCCNVNFKLLQATPVLALTRCSIFDVAEYG